MRAAGAVLVVAGLALALRSAFLLAGRGRPQRGPRPAFVIAGPYRRMRNPLLAGVVVALAGATLATRSGTLALATALGAVAAHVFVVRVEEPSLTSRFGDAYVAYRERVPRWWPGSGRSEDEDT
jgi:protein-S-isoprenylcysteine O-methyltransferase Ste14